MCGNLCDPPNDTSKNYHIPKKLYKEDSATKNNQDRLDKIQMDTFVDWAFGCILGAFLADSIGSYWESNSSRMQDSDINYCFTMPGGGIHSIRPGQVTDDSEMALCLMRGIVKSQNDLDCRKNEKILNADIIAREYSRWIDSDPIDIEVSA